MKQAVILTIHGRVQGVGFRYFVKQKADSLGICGYVKNKLNGLVYVEAEGETEQLQLFIHAMRIGPSHAWVENVDEQYCPVQGYKNFERR
jgi:acylphosphatase